jgi:heme oxygenase
MSLKDITADLHDLAENTPFMKAVFAKTLPQEIWTEWTYWKLLFYFQIEKKCEEGGLLDDLQGLKRCEGLWKDFLELRNGDESPTTNSINNVLVEYENYIKLLTPQQALAHLYVWHMGDLYGGQMIKKTVSAPSHHSLEFEDASTLKTNLRDKLTDNLGTEARTAFEFAIKMMKELYSE